MNIKIKLIIFFIVLVGIVLSLGHTLNPFDPRMFNFHDDTQAARVQQMALNIINFQIPPRLAPELSHNLGFPVFNFYAPTSYWITTILYLLGLPIAISIKLSFLLSIIVSFISMSILGISYFGFLPGLAAGIMYASSLWFAVEIFVRGNIAESWFIAFFPLSLSFISQLKKKKSPVFFVITTLVIAFTITSHNVLSMIGLLLLCLFSLINKRKKWALLSIVLAVCLSAYFLIPAIFELPLTHATANAIRTRYNDHFLCISQIWKTKSWEYSGSAIGCEDDGMPFTLGKIHLILGFAGVCIFMFSMILSRKKKPFDATSLFMLLMGLTSLFLTTYQSAFVWSLLHSIMDVFQFPWRFLVFVVFALSYFGAYFFSYIVKKQNKIGSLITIVSICMLLFTSSKFFSKPWLMTSNEYQIAYGSENYMRKTVAYNMAEYLPISVNYSYWRSFDPQLYPGANKKIGVTESSPVESNPQIRYQVLKNNIFFKQVTIKNASTITLNIHYFPFWEIKIDGEKITPDNFDKLGRPILKIYKPSEITIAYKQTLVEVIGNSFTLITFVILAILLFYKPLWKKTIQYLK